MLLGRGAAERLLLQHCAAGGAQRALDLVRNAVLLAEKMHLDSLVAMP